MRDVELIFRRLVFLPMDVKITTHFERHFSRKLSCCEEWRGERQKIRLALTLTRFLKCASQRLLWIKPISNIYLKQSWIQKHYKLKWMEDETMKITYFNNLDSLEERWYLSNLYKKWTLNWITKWSYDWFYFTYME